MCFFPGNPLRTITGNDFETLDDLGLSVAAYPVSPQNANEHGYVYDLKDNLTSDVITTTNTYTSRAYTTSYTYDVGNRLKNMTYPNPGTSEVVTTTYNSQGMGLPASMTSNVGSNPNPVYDTTYNEWGELTSLRQGSAVQSNLLTTQFAYNVRGWLTNTLATTSSGSTTLLNLSMSYDLNGNVSSVSNQNITNPSTTNPTYTNSFSYDWLNRLSSATSTSSQIGSLFVSEQYTFDNLSRMATRTIAGKAYNYKYGDPSHVDAPTYYDYTKGTYGYDAAGNQTSGTVTGVSQTRSVDPENRISSIVTGTTTLSFVYDGDGKRLLQSVTQGSSTTRTLYVGNLYEETLSDANHAYTIYYYLGAKMVGERKGNYSTGNGQYRIVGDQLGSTTLIVDTASPPNVVYRAYYKPYGEVAFAAGQDQTAYGYTGQRLDGDSGLMYYGARYYDPALSYFISADPTVPDPSNAVDYNKYLYARANPLLYVDTTGYGPKDYYVLVSGCLFNPWDCAKDTSIQGEYTVLLQTMFQFGGWGEDYYGPGRDISWDDWQKTHVVPVNISLDDFQNGNFGADKLAAKIANIPSDARKIHLLGHSAGAAAVLAYLYGGYAGIYDINRRIASATMIDGPLDLMDSFWGTDSGFTNYICSNTLLCNRGTLDVRDIDTKNDPINSKAIPGLPSYTYVGNPTYPATAIENGKAVNAPAIPNVTTLGLPWSTDNGSRRIAWHGWTGRHMATETRQFLNAVWP